MSFLRRLTFILALMASTALLSACADMPKTPAEQAEFRATDDPLEPVNRVVFDVNDFLDRLLFHPLAELYRATIPPGLRDRVAGILSNMREPVIFANNLLQGEVTRAGTTAARFGLNTTLGAAGMFEVANDYGLQQQTGDFGQTLNTWGFNGGPYLVLPLFGPSNFRDAIGLGIDTLMSPWQYLAAIDGRGTENRLSYTSFVMDGVVKREQNIEALNALQEGSLDFYAQMRSVYKQYRAKQMGGEDVSDMPNFDEN